MSFRSLIQDTRPPLPSFDRRFVLFYWDERRTSDGRVQWVPIFEIVSFASDLSAEIDELRDSDTPFRLFHLYGDALPDAVASLLAELAGEHGAAYRAEGTVPLIPDWITAHVADPQDAFIAAVEQDMFEVAHLNDVASPYLSGRGG